MMGLEPTIGVKKMISWCFIAPILYKTKNAPHFHDHILWIRGLFIHGAFQCSMRRSGTHPQAY
jgi:hypothetical protein